MTRPDEIFFDPKGNKLKNLVFFGKIFLKPEVTDPTQPDSSNKKNDPTRQGSKRFDPDPITTDNLSCT